MSMTDPVADMLTRIRNANSAIKPHTDVPASKLKGEILRVLLEQRYIAGYNFIESGKQGLYRIYLKYAPGRKRVITKLERVSRPGLRKYVTARQVQQVLSGLGLAVISTSKGLMSDDQCRQDNLGGEVICQIW